VEFYVVRDQDLIRRIGACKQMGGSQINGADAVIVVTVRTEDRQAAEFWIEDGAIASSYILLAAEQYDLGACWVHIRNRRGKRKLSDEEVRELLGIPEGYAVLNLIALGGKGEYKRAYTEKDFDFRKIHREVY
jgi:nitroreductase